MSYCRVGYLISLITESYYTLIHELDKERQERDLVNPSSYCYCFGPEMACDLYREGTLLRCGKMKLTMLNFDLVGAVPVFVQCFAGQRCKIYLVVQLTSH